MRTAFWYQILLFLTLIILLPKSYAIPAPRRLTTVIHWTEAAFNGRFNQKPPTTNNFPVKDPGLYIIQELRAFVP
jgi:hypothetical protein